MQKSNRVTRSSRKLSRNERTFRVGTIAGLRINDGTRVSRVKVTRVTQTSDSVLDANGVTVEHLDGSKLVEDVLFSSNRLIRIKDDYDNLGVVRDISHLGNNDGAQNCFVI